MLIDKIIGFVNFTGVNSHFLLARNRCKYPLKGENRRFRSASGYFWTQTEDRFQSRIQGWYITIFRFLVPQLDFLAIFCRYALITPIYWIPRDSSWVAKLSRNYKYSLLIVLLIDYLVVVLSPSRYKRKVKIPLFFTLDRFDVIFDSWDSQKTTFWPKIM